MTEIEIPDEPQPDEEPAARDEEPSGPYKNLFVPLVVVPAMIVMVLVLVYALFGAIAGTASSPRENLDLLLHGGFNERQQAAFGLVRQVLEYQHAKAEGREPEWDIDASFLPELQAARASQPPVDDPEDVLTPFVLSSLLAQLGDSEGVHQLIEMTRLTDGVDPEGEFRFYAAFTLGAIGGDLGEAERVAAARSLIELLASPDDGLVLAAATGLQNLPGPETVPALQGLLGSRSVDQRLQAALSLAALDDASGAGVLEEMVHQEPYLAERAENPAKWADRRIYESRHKALEGLVRLGLPPGREQLEVWADGDPDPEMRDLALRLLSQGAG